ncbi:MAG: ribokinase [Clostridia bacterium]|nr:ribokinase [Clostridia bacterium]
MKIYNLGSLNVDYVYSVDSFVTAGETISCADMKVFPGGKGLNQSVAAARAGGDVIHGALLGDGADFLAEQLAASGVDTSKIRRVAGSPGHAIIQVDKCGENCIMIYPGTNRMLDDAYVEEFLSGAREGDILLLQNETNCIAEAIDAAKEKGMRVVLNPSPFNDAITALPLDKVDLWFCNEIEGAALTGESDAGAICGAFLERFPDASLVLTLGEDGSVYCDKNGKTAQAAYKATPIDTTAAGDTFTGYFLASICDGKSVRDALDTASRASAITVSRPGASSSVPYIDELL